MISDAVSSILTAVAPDRETARAGAEPRRLMGLALKAAAEAAAPRRRMVRRMLGNSEVEAGVRSWQHFMVPRERKGARSVFFAVKCIFEQKLKLLVVKFVPKNDPRSVSELKGDFDISVGIWTQAGPPSSHLAVPKHASHHPPPRRRRLGRRLQR